VTEAQESRRKIGNLALATAGCIALLMPMIAPPAPLLVWNMSASVPPGLYVVRRGEPPVRGDIVAAWPPSSARRLAAERRYLPGNVPLLKPVGALAGTRICACGWKLLIDGKPVARRSERDGAGRRLPWWHGCVALTLGQLLLLAPRSDDSFDGRYFGPSEQGDVIGTVRLLWRA